MSSTKKPIVIHVKVTNGTLGQKVKVRNLTSGGSVVGMLNASAETIVNSPQLYNWKEGDTIVAESHGKVIQSASSTITSGGATFTLSNSASTSTAAVVLG